MKVEKARTNEKKFLYTNFWPSTYVLWFKEMCWEDFFLKINKRVVPNKGVLDGKLSQKEINVQHVY